MIRHHLLSVPCPICATSSGYAQLSTTLSQKLFFENGSLAFERRTNAANKRRKEDANIKKIAKLEEKLQKKNKYRASLGAMQ